jgi:hypothetical protein
MKRDEVFPSKFLKAADLGGREVTVTIKDAPLELLKSPSGEEQSKVVLYFAGKKKSLPLNRVNWDTVAGICGDDTEDWQGGQITLYPAKTEMAGKSVDCIRIKRPNGDLPLAKKAGAKKNSAVEEPVVDTDDGNLDDEIPF